jgi:hypothetical protein
MVFLVVPLSVFQPFCDKIDIPFGGPDAGRRFLLKRVEDIHHLLESNGVYKYVISAMTSRGGNRRGNRASREVFPLCCWTRRQFIRTAISAGTY